MDCFLCAQRLDGDDVFIQHHINSCLDSQVTEKPPGSGASSPRGRVDAGEQRRQGSSDNSGKGQSEEKSLSKASSGFDFDERLASDAAVARALAESLDEEAALELSQKMNWEERDHLGVDRLEGEDDENGVRPPGCPLCEMSWEELGVDEDDRDQHAENCLLGNGGEQGTRGQKYEEMAAESAGTSTTFVWGGGSTKDQVKGSAGMLRIISSLLVRSHKDGKTRAAYLASESTEHVAGQFRDWGWGCGYRNAQMIFSSLRHLDCYKSIHGNKSTLPQIPTIPELQMIIEQAWKNGHDPPGAAHFNHKLRGSKKWIGTTEIYTALTWLGIRAKVIDFPKVAGSNGTHAALVRWITNYFSTPFPTSPLSKKRPLPSGSPPDALQVLMESEGSPVKMTKKQPLYLQHQGHSRTVVGVDVGNGGEWLLIYDPGKSISNALKKAAASAPGSPNLEPNKRPKTSTSSSSSSSDAFWAQTPGFEQIWHGKSAAKGPSASNAALGVALDLASYAKHLEPFRVSLNSLSKKEQYQIIYVEEGPMLTVQEKAMRKVVGSTRITA